MDKIIIDSDQKVIELNNWFGQNADEIVKRGFHPPLNEGCIILGNAKVQLNFKIKGSDVEFFHYDRVYGEMSTFSYNLITRKSYVDYPDGAPASAVESMRQGQRLMIQTFLAVMSLLLYHKDAMAESLIRSKEPDKLPKPQKKAKTKKKSKQKQPAAHTQRVYVLSNFEPAKATEQLLKAKRKYTKPDTEVQVRGHYRTYPSGKRVWVKPFTKYNGKKNKKDKEYIL